MSGVSDAVLEELLEVNKAMAASLSAMANQRGTGGGGGSRPDTGQASGIALGLFTKSVGFAAGIMTGTFSHALNIASAGLVTLTSVGKTLIQNQMSLSEGAIAGTNSLSSLTAGLSNLPFGLGLVAQAMTYQTKVLEQNVKTYQEISESGARFGGSLAEVRISAKNMGLSMDEFSAVMKTNTPQLRFFGESAEDGAKKMVQFNSGLVKGDVGKQLLGMGYSLTEVNNLLGSYSAAIGGLNQNQFKDQKQMQQSVKFFAEELDASAQLEGKTRQQKEDEMKEASAQAAVRAKLSEMGPEEQKKYLAAYNAALRIGGKGAAEALQSQLLGLPPMTKAAQLFTAVNGEAAGTVKKLTDTITDGSKATDARAKQDRLAAEGVVQSGNKYKELGTTAAALSMQNGDMAETINAGAKNYADNMNTNVKTAADAENRIKAVRSEQEKAQKSQVGATVQAQAQAKYAGDLMNMLANALSPLFPVITDLIKAFSIIAPKVIKLGTDIVTQFIMPLFKDLFGGMKLDDIIKPFKDFFSGLFGSGGMDLAGAEKGVAGFLKPMIKFIGDAAKAIDWVAVGAAFRKTFQTVGNFIVKISTALGDVFGGSSAGGDFGKILQSSFNDLMDGIDELVNGIGFVVKLIGSSPLMGTLKEMFGKVFHLLKSLVDAVVAIVESPLGTFVIEVILDVFNLLGEMINALIDAVTDIVDIITDVTKFFSQDFSTAMNQIYTCAQQIVGTIIGFVTAIPGKIAEIFAAAMVAIPKFISGIVNAIIDGIIAIKDGIVNFFEGGYQDFYNAVVEAIKGIIGSIVNGIKNIGTGIANFFTGAVADSKGQQPPAQPQQNPSQPAKAQPAQPKPAQPQTPKQQNVTASKAALEEKAREKEKLQEKTQAEKAAEKARSAAAKQAEKKNEVAASVASNSNDPVEMLRAEIETLNNSIRMLQRSMADTADNTKKTATILASGGNLFKR